VDSHDVHDKFETHIHPHEIGDWIDHMHGDGRDGGISSARELIRSVEDDPQFSHHLGKHYSYNKDMWDDIASHNYIKHPLLHMTKDNDIHDHLDEHHSDGFDEMGYEAYASDLAHHVGKHASYETLKDRIFKNPDFSFENRGYGGDKPLIALHQGISENVDADNIHHKILDDIKSGGYNDGLDDDHLYQIGKNTKSHEILNRLRAEHSNNDDVKYGISRNEIYGG
jgi:hypothetical protein